MLIKMCSNGRYDKFCAGEYLSHALPFHTGLKQGDMQLPWIFNFILKCVIWNVQENQKGLELNRTH
jgi:hypothetical protein